MIYTKEQLLKYAELYRFSSSRVSIQQFEEMIKEHSSETLHADSEKLLDVCFEELRLKLIKNQNKYGWSNEWLTQDWEDECREQMMNHIKKGDPRDVAIYAMFMIYRGWSTNADELNSVSSR